MNIHEEPFGEFEGSPVELYTLDNGHGVVVKITTYGGTVTSITTPDKHGNGADIVCGFETLASYFTDQYKGNSPYFGCLVGRYAARIKDGKFTVDGNQHQVATNDGPNHLHGGIIGYDKRIWSVESTAEEDDHVALTLTLDSPDGEESFPGHVEVTVEYKLTADNQLRINYKATTDKTTPLSLTNHTYFNLNGFTDTVLDHVLQLSADRFLVCDETNVPVGEEMKVAGSVYDFNSPKRIGDAFGKLEMGFEHYYAFTKSPDALETVARVSEPKTGRTLEVLTSEPGTLLYTGRYTSDDLKRESGAQFGQFRGFCLETSKYPNGPNIDNAPRSVLSPGTQYDETTVYKFGVEAPIT